MTGDSEIIRRIREGDAGQFESLFRSSYVSLVRYAMTVIKDHDTAEEIVQDLFFRLWQNRKDLKIDSSLNGYLFRSVYNRCLHHIDHGKVIIKHAEDMKNREETMSETPSDILDYKELQARIAAVIERLPLRCGKIFCMNRFEGLKYNEIAEKLSVSVKTVEADMGKALREFRRELKDEERDEKKR